jgi:ABC-type branched-subunit amino acid transport system substrate-binding protein
MHRTRRRAIAKVAVAGLVGALALATAASAASGQASPTPGVTKQAITLGYLYTGTGVAASSFTGSDGAFQARIDRENANGGVNGRTIKTELIDDKSSPANLTGAKDLVENRDVFAVVDNSPFAFLSYRYLLDAGVPMIGGGFDGTYYGTKGNENVVSALGNSTSSSDKSSTTLSKIVKQLGGTKVATLAYGASSSAVSAAKALQDFAVPAVGLEAVYTNTSVDFGTSDVGPLVLGVKNSGANATVLPMVSSTNLALVQGLQQAGVEMKANLLLTGYGQDLLDSPAAKTLGKNTILYSQYKPVELKDAATKQFQRDLKKYAHYDGVPGYGQYLGYITAELAILGLRHAGATPTRQSFIDGLHKLGTYDAAGLACQPIDISLTNFGKVPDTGCAYYVYVDGGKFKVLDGGKPVSGKTVGTPEAVANETFPVPTTAAKG